MTKHEIDSSGAEGGEGAVRGCRDALRKLASHLDGELDAAAEREIERHLSICRSCFSRAQFEKRLGESIRTLGREPVSGELSHRIHRLIRKFDVAEGL